jgi:[ribosomal protein S5]-alanine N-acetyltransferase
MLHFELSPFPLLRTPRLLLRRITAADAPALRELRSDEAVLRFIGKEPTATLQEAQALIERMDASLAKNEGIMWGLAPLDDEARLVGTCGLWRLDPENHRGEVGYLLHPSCWGKGLMGEALTAVCRHGFEQLHLHSIEAHVDPANAASTRVLERAGFVREGLFRECVYFRGRFSDSAVYSLLAPA